MNIQKTTALVPMRGGSKSIPFKNIRPLAGKPLCAWALEAAVQSGIFDKIIVSTDSAEIADIVCSLPLEIEIVPRPTYLATDDATTDSVMYDLLSHVDFEVLTTIQVTSPLVRSVDFVNAFDYFNKNKLDSLLTGVRVKRFFWNDDGTPLNYNPLKRPMRQQFAGNIMENGAFYMTKREILLQHKCRLGGKTGVYEMLPETALEIDEPSDWAEIEQIILQQKQDLLNQRLKKTKMVFLDVDGTLTDAGMYYTREGDAMKKFNTRDGLGIRLLKNSGVRVVIITSENSEIVKARALKLGIEDCHIGVLDKLPVVKKMCKELKIPLAECVFVGDDLNDMESMRETGFAACPSDAEESVKKISAFVASREGGNGAVREICDLIVKAKNE